MMKSDTFTIYYCISGCTIGHRSLMRYYRQNMVPYGGQLNSKSNVLSRVMSQYKALGWTGTTGKYSFNPCDSVM